VASNTVENKYVFKLALKVVSKLQINYKIQLKYELSSNVTTTTATNTRFLRHRTDSTSTEAMKTNKILNSKKKVTSK